jgi:hypothetical protein
MLFQKICLMCKNTNVVPWKGIWPAPSHGTRSVSR